MQISEIIKLEDANDDGIILFKEGMFWRAYERSAFRFSNLIKEYQVLVRYYKNVDRKMVYLGFPSEKLPNVIAHCKIKGWKVSEGDNGTWIINALPDVDGFQQWKNELVEKQDEKKPKERISVPGLVREDNKTTSTLPVYKDSYDLMLEVYQFSKHFDREYRFTLGERLKNEILALLINVYQAQTSDNKKGKIIQARTHAELSRLLFRVSKDLHLIELKRFIRLNEKLEDIMRQLSGWLKAQK